MLKGLFGPKLAEDVKALRAGAESWASSLSYQYELLKTGHIRIRGDTAGYHWRLTAGPSARSYFKQSEIKLGLSAHIIPQLQGVICTRRLAAIIKQQVYGEAVAGANTHSMDGLPFEMTLVSTGREQQMTGPVAEQLACYFNSNPLLESYTLDYLKALPGGLGSLELNTLLPWIVAIQGAGIVLRLGVPNVTLDHIKSALRMQVALIKPLKLIEETNRPAKAPDSIPSR